MAGAVEKTNSTGPPSVVILAGPNGAGKSAAASVLLHGVLRVEEFVNADTIASGLGNVAGVAITAGRSMLERLRALARARATFAFETTLSSRTLAPWLEELRRDGYVVHLVFLWLSSPGLAVRRVADRVAVGGHDVPEATIRRRYRVGLRNFLAVYQSQMTSWILLDSSRPAFRRIAERCPVGHSPFTMKLRGGS